MLASWSPQPNWMPRNPKLMLYICQKLKRGFTASAPRAAGSVPRDACRMSPGSAYAPRRWGKLRPTRGSRTPIGTLRWAARWPPCRSTVCRATPTARTKLTPPTRRIRATWRHTTRVAWDATGRSRSARSEAPLEFLADVQHELRISRHPVRLGTPARQHVGGVRATRGPAGPGAAALAGRAAHGAPRAADRRRPERPHVGAAGAPPSLLPHRRHSGLDRALPDADLERAVDGSGPPLDTRCLDQHLDGAVPRVRRRQARRVAADCRVRAAVVLHRSRRQSRQCPAAAVQLVRRAGQHVEWSTTFGEVLLPGRRGGVLPCRAVDGSDNQ